jgi:hypothetical protein
MCLLRLVPYELFEWMFQSRDYGISLINFPISAKWEEGSEQSGLGDEYRNQLGKDATSRGRKSEDGIVRLGSNGHVVPSSPS